MRRLYAILVILLVVVAAAYLSLSWPSSHGGPPAGPSTLSTNSAQAIPVGVVLYLWYGNATTNTGGLGSPGWNSTNSPGGGAVVDTPNIGYYVSDSNRTFRTQISEMQGAGISFAIVSWWGPSTSGEAGAINRATVDLIRYLEHTNSSFKLSIMVDAFGSGGPTSLPVSQTYRYVQDTFVNPYRRWYFDWQGKPLLLFFNPLQPGQNVNFTVRTIGNRPNPVNWIFWDAPQNFSQGEGGTGVNLSNDIGNPWISADGEVTLVPRIDSYYNYADGYQSGYLRFDDSLRLGLYQYEWNYALTHRDGVKLVLIYSWNEYHERTAIEPQVDGTSTLGEDYLLNLTAGFVSMLDPSR